MWQTAGSPILLCQCIEERWESQSRLMLCVVSVGLSKNALNLSSLVTKMCVYISCILYVSIQGMKASGALTELPRAQRSQRGITL